MRRRNAILLLFVTLTILAQIPTPASAHDFDQVITAGNHYIVLFGDAQTGGSITGSFTVTSGNDVEFFICDADNYDRWLNGLSASVYEHRSRTTSYTFEFTVPEDGNWHVIFSNEYSWITSKHVQGSVNYEAPSPIGPGSSDVIFGIIILGILALCFIVCVKIGQSLLGSDSRKQEAPYEMVTPILVPEPNETYVATSTQVSSPSRGFCTYCGTSRQSSDSRYCASCGKEFDN